MRQRQKDENDLAGKAVKATSSQVRMRVEAEEKCMVVVGGWGGGHALARQQDAPDAARGGGGGKGVGGAGGERDGGAILVAENDSGVHMLDNSDSSGAMWVSGGA